MAMPESASAHRVRGKLVYWRKRGYGFIASPDLPRDAWVHQRFIIDPTIDMSRPLPVGMELEFEPRYVEGGKIQAHNVTLPTSNAAQTCVRGRATASGAVENVDGNQSAGVLEVQAPVVFSTASLERDAPAQSSRYCPSLASRVAEERARIEAERLRLHSEVERLSREADELESESAEIAREFDTRIAELMRERERQLGALRDEAEGSRRDAAALRARLESLPSVSAKSSALVEQDLKAARSRLVEWLTTQARTFEDAAVARRTAVAAVGEDLVRNYEEIRKRRDATTDDVDKVAYDLAEKATRPSIRGYAEVLDALQMEPEPLGIIVLSSAKVDGRLVIAAPIAPEDLERDDIRWRIGAFLIDAAERAGREMNAVVTIGETFGSLAAELRPWGVEPELVEVAVQEAWEARRSLSAAFTLTRELVPGVEPPFEHVAFRVPTDDSAEASDRDLRSVARRLGLSMPDLLASLVGAGLPYDDDKLDPGSEQSLTELLRDYSLQESDMALATKAAPVQQSKEASRPELLAKKLLEKLVRDRRVGGRHTDESNVWGHHFADDEKSTVKELVRRLVRAGILQRRARAGSDHVSIDPRRMRDVRKIIELRWDDAALFADLE